MPKYWVKNYFAHGSFPEVGQKQKTEKKEEEDWTMVITMAKLRMAHASTHGARKPPGPISRQIQPYLIKIDFQDNFQTLSAISTVMTNFREQCLRARAFSHFCPLLPPVSNTWPVGQLCQINLYLPLQVFIFPRVLYWVGLEIYRVGEVVMDINMGLCGGGEIKR